MGKGNLFGNYTWTLYGSDVDKRIRFIHTHNVRTLANIKAKNSLFCLAFAVIHCHTQIIETRLKNQDGFSYKKSRSIQRKAGSKGVLG